MRGKADRDKKKENNNQHNATDNVGLKLQRVF